MGLITKDETKILVVNINMSSRFKFDSKSGINIKKLNNNNNLKPFALRQAYKWFG